MDITDYIPNIFGRSAPSYLPGLLGAEETKNLQNRANVQGLLGAGLALAQGMSRTGPRRSAAENILGALSGGFGAAGGAYEQGVKNYVTQQQIAQTQLAQQKALIERQQYMAQQGAIENLLKSPEIANDPLKVAYIRANPNEALKLYSELLPLQQAGQTLNQPAVQPQVNAPQVTSQVQPVPTTAQAGQENVLPPVVVSTKPSAYNARLAEKQRIEQIINTYSNPQFAGNERAGKIVDQNLKRLEVINKEITKASVSDLSGDLQSFRNSAPPQFQSQIDNLINIASTGEISPDQLSQRTNDISKQINDYNQKELDFKRAQNDYTKAAYRVGAKVAPGVDPSKYTPEILAKIQAELKAEEKELRIASRNITNVNVGEKKFAEQFGTGVAKAVEKTYDNALAAQSTLSTIKTIRPLIKDGVYSGPLSSSKIYIDRLASSFGIASGTIEDKLARTSQAMQGLASLELEASKSMAGQGAITDFERGLIARASAGNFAQFTAKEVASLMDALEKVANRKITTHTKNLERLRKRPDTAELADFYELGGGNTLEDAVSDELRKRGQ
jgi:polyhydroxyalkanoate synthesis regulator phasin